MDTIDWLLDGDPAIRWQAIRDLTDTSPAAVAAERARVAREGIGATILAHQGSDGSWHRGNAGVVRPRSPQLDAEVKSTLVKGKQLSDGLWILEGAHDEALAFQFGEAVGEPSRWNTLRALRVLRWYQRGRPLT